MVRKRDIISSFITEILLALKEVTKVSLGFAQFLNNMADQDAGHLTILPCSICVKLCLTFVPLLC